MPGVFVLKDADTLVSMESAHFASEADFQTLLSKFPELLVGEQIDPANPRRWLLVKREMSIPSEDNGSGRWSVDHLFVDQDGVPTLVEVKRQSDTRIRREVVGQMLDYAANAVSYWPVEAIRAELDATCQQRGKSIEECISQLLGPEGDVDTFWVNVKTNLEAGRIRMLFVADSIPSELRKIIEFLNRQMDPAEVLGVELRQFEGQGLKTIVPMVLGQTEAAVQKKRPATGERSAWTEERILAAIGTRTSPEVVQVAEKIIGWMKAKGDRLWHGNGVQQGSIGAVVDAGQFDFYPAFLWSYGSIELQFQWMRRRPFFEKLENRQELARRLNVISGISIAEGDLERRPSFPVAALIKPENLAVFLDTMDWAIAKFQEAAV